MSLEFAESKVYSYSPKELKRAFPFLEVDQSDEVENDLDLGSDGEIDEETAKFFGKTRFAASEIDSTCFNPPGSLAALHPDDAKASLKESSPTPAPTFARPPGLDFAINMPPHAKKSAREGVFGSFLGRNTVFRGYATILYGATDNDIAQVFGRDDQIRLERKQKKPKLTDKMLNEDKIEQILDPEQWLEAALRKWHTNCVVCGKVAATYGYPGCGASTCLEHQKEGMIDVRHAMCVDCGSTRASFGPANGPALFCASCRDERGGKTEEGEEIVDKWNKFCEDCGNTRATFGTEQGVARYCAGCRDKRGGVADGETIVDVKHQNQMCVECDKVRAQWGPADGTPLYCAACRDIHGGKMADGKKLVDLGSAICIDCNESHASYGPAGGALLFCAKCRDKRGGKTEDEEDIVYLKAGKCRDCRNTMAKFGPLNGSALYCKPCSDARNGKTEDGQDLIDVRSVKCKDCHKVQPSYGPPGSKQVLYCSGCAKKRMAEAEAEAKAKAKLEKTVDEDGDDDDDGGEQSEEMTEPVKFVDNRNKQNRCLDCGKNASYVLEGTKKRISCAACAKKRNYVKDRVKLVDPRKGRVYKPRIKK